MISLKYNFIIIILFSILASSCITTRNLEYISSEEDIVRSSSYDYKIQKNDLISVQISSTTSSEYDFFNLQETSNPQLLSQNPYLYGYLVKSDGIVTLPMIGEVKVDGFTIDEVESLIENISSTYFKDPIVKVNVLNFYVSILGEVNQPGKYNIIRANQNILHLIAEAEDLTEFANRKRVKVIRNYTDNSSKIFYLDLTDPSILNNQDFYLHPQDIIYVEPLNDFYAGFRSMSSAISLSISAITLYFLITNN